MCFTDMSLSLFMLPCIVVSQNKLENLNVMKTIFFVLFAMLICACSNESKNDAFKVRRIYLLAFMKIYGSAKGFLSVDSLVQIKNSL